MTDYSKREWKPGDVAMRVGPNGNEKIAVCVTGCDRHGNGSPHWHTVSKNGRPDWDTLTFGDVTYRPLALIDPENREHVERMCRAYYSKQPQDPAARVDLREHMANALREFIAPEPLRLLEPGTYGIVRASCVHSKGKRLEWVRDPDGNWRCIGPGYTSDNADDWDSLIDPILLRPGIDDRTGESHD